MELQCKDRKKLTVKQLEEKRAYDRNRKRTETAAKIAEALCVSTDKINMYTCNKQYLFRGNILNCKFKFMGRLNRCTFHPKKDYEYGRISGNYNPNDTNPKLIRKMI
jgi:hypothetical protein